MADGDEKATTQTLEGKLTERADPNALVDVHVFDWKRILIALVKASGLHSGIWRVRASYAEPKDLTVNQQVPGHGVRTYPGQIVGLTSLQLVPDDTIGPLSVDAAIVNPDNRIVLPFGPKASTRTM